MIGVAGAVAVALWAFNHHRAKSAVLYFEEVPPELIMMLGLASIRLSEIKIDLDRSDLGRPEEMRRSIRHKLHTNGESLPPQVLP